MPNKKVVTTFKQFADAFLEWVNEFDEDTKGEEDDDGEDTKGEEDDDGEDDDGEDDDEDDDGEGDDGEGDDGEGDDGEGDDGEGDDGEGDAPASAAKLKKGIPYKLAQLKKFKTAELRIIGKALGLKKMGKDKDTLIAAIAKRQKK